MDTAKLKRFAQGARRNLLEQVASRMAMVLQPNSPARRENPAAIKQIDEQIASDGKAQLIDKVAYTWFNRFCALRYMDVNRVNRIGVVSPLENQVQPEIVAEAKMGHIDDEMVPAALQATVRDLLDGRATSMDPQGEAYRLLIVAVCNYWHKVMPFLFERIADYTELLMPDNLLSGNSILAEVRAAMTNDACQDVEVIGWLYQFYISERKDAVFEGMKKGRKITPDNIPAATQLFTPHWIVRYLLENSLGRLWMLNHPDSRLVEQMAYYIKPEQAETGFLRIEKPEDIKVCDPACGSGHMLTYAFDLLYAMYEEVGTDVSDIPAKILIHNLYGIEIDERAGDLAAFALSMKARAKQRRFFSKAIAPNICVLEKISFNSDELEDYMAAVGRDLFTPDLRETLQQFEEADNFGSLIRPKLTQVQGLLSLLSTKDLNGQLFLSATHERVLTVLRQAEYLSTRYQIVVANPPYMSSSGMNGRLGAWAKGQYPGSKSDLFSMFMERNLALVVPRGVVGMITMQSWMFLSSFEKFRNRLLDEDTIVSMAHLGARAFDSIGGEVVSTTAFVLERGQRLDYKGSFLRLVDGNSEREKAAAIQGAMADPDRDCCFRASAADFRKLPGSPIAYWISELSRNTFVRFPKLSTISTSAVGQNTGDNDRFLRYWHEVSFSHIRRDCSSRESTYSGTSKWYPYNKGGGYRKWYGNFCYVINWHNDAEEIKTYAVERNDGKHWSRYIQNLEWLFHEGITWSDVTSGRLSCRYLPAGYISDVSGHCAFFDVISPNIGLSILNSRFVSDMSRVLNPTIHFQAGNYRDIPYSDKLNAARTVKVVSDLIAIARKDWDASETWLDFTGTPLLPSNDGRDLRKAYARVQSDWQAMTQEMLLLEEENNRIFIDAYDLQNEVTPEVLPAEVTLTCNPHYRYGSSRTEEERESLLLADTICDFISYAVGCMFGRYSLDKTGLVLANQGETLADYLRQVPHPTFTPAADNVIPLLDGEWFDDDITERFRSFLRLTFGEAHYTGNLKFIESALGKDIRKFFLRDFYNDHARRYRKRPIYWLFSSPKSSFNALVYLHRYRPDTVSVVLQYLRDFQEKLTGERKRQQQINISASASQAEKTRALKSIDSLKKILAELDDYERDVLHPLATQQIGIDLDDGVKVNYLKFGAALRKIPGLDAGEEE